MRAAVSGCVPVRRHEATTRRNSRGLPVGRWGIAFLAAFAVTPAWADIALRQTWTVSPPFGKNEEARRALSGAACVTGTTKCFVVNDEKKYGQFLDLAGPALVPGRVIRLLPDRVDGIGMGEIDAEAVAYAPPGEPGGKAYIYFTGSHGLSRKGELRTSQFFLFRFPVDAISGEPTFVFDDHAPAPEIERTALIRTVLKDHPDLAPFAERPLDADGVTIEGLAVRGDDLLLGLRSPSPGGKAFVVRLATKDLFGPAVPRASVLRVQLDPATGIRDMAVVSTGLLLLAGRSREPTKKAVNAARAMPAEPTPTVWFWDARSESARRLGSLPGVGPEAKAETLLLLEETPAAYRVLVMFDDAEDGTPTEYLVPRDAVGDSIGSGR